MDKSPAQLYNLIQKEIKMKIFLSSEAQAALTELKAALKEFQLDISFENKKILWRLCRAINAVNDCEKETKRLCLNFLVSDLPESEDDPSDFDCETHSEMRDLHFSEKKEVAGIVNAYLKALQIKFSF